MQYKNIQNPIQLSELKCLENVIFNRYATREIAYDCKETFIRKFNNELYTMLPTIRNLLKLYFTEFSPFISGTKSKSTNFKEKGYTEKHGNNTNTSVSNITKELNENNDNSEEHYDSNFKKSQDFSQNASADNEKFVEDSHTLKVHSDTPQTMLWNKPAQWYGEIGSGKGEWIINDNPWYHYATDADNINSWNNHTKDNLHDENSYVKGLEDYENYDVKNGNSNHFLEDKESSKNDYIGYVNDYLQNKRGYDTIENIKECNDIIDNLLKYIQFYKFNIYDYIFDRLEKYFLGVWL